jgi:hypothetical protein
MHAKAAVLYEVGMPLRLGLNPTRTLLVNSKTCGEAGWCITLASQRDQARVSGDTHALDVGD